MADARGRIEQIIRELRQSAGSTPEIRAAHDAALRTNNLASARIAAMRALHTLLTNPVSH